MASPTEVLSEDLQNDESRTLAPSSLHDPTPNALPRIVEHEGDTENRNVDQYPKALRELTKLRETCTIKRIRLREKRVTLKFKREEVIKNYDELFTWVHGNRKSKFGFLVARENDYQEDVEKCRLVRQDYANLESEYNSLDIEYIRDEFTLEDTEERLYKKLKALKAGNVEGLLDISLSSTVSPEVPSELCKFNPSDYSSVDTDQFEEALGAGTAIGEIPDLTGTGLQLGASQEQPYLVNRAWTPDPETPGSSECGHGLKYSQSCPNFNVKDDTVDIRNQTGHTSLSAFPLLLNEEHDTGILNPLLTDFKNTRDRINQWILHKLRVSVGDQLLLAHLVSREIEQQFDTSQLPQCIPETWSTDEATTTLYPTSASIGDVEMQGPIAVKRSQARDLLDTPLIESGGLKGSSMRTMKSESNPASF
ncbi:MAG: hypothetical protein M1834_007765 [Cirrosporium novae-zelandiae]|nr:MAG: hypothetical protein M1834_007765 [Cirrosporium novae-zelandiae]